MPFSMKPGGCRKRAKTMKKDWKLSRSCLNKAYRVSYCCSIFLLVLACCWWTVLCGWVGQCCSQNGGPRRSSFPVMDGFGWKLGGAMTLLIACMFHGVMPWIVATAPLSPEPTVSTLGFLLFLDTITTALAAKCEKSAAIPTNLHSTNWHNTLIIIILLNCLLD